MAKKNKRKRQGGGSNGVFGEDLVREIIGNWAGTLLASGTGVFAARLASRGARQAPDDDVTARVLQSLAEHGPRTVAELVEDTGEGLTPVLDALRSAREFRLVEFVEDRDVVQLSDGGSSVVAVLRKAGPGPEVARMLEA